MNKKEKLLLAVMRIAMGWLMFYAGITKVLNPEWSAAGYAKSAKSLSGLYAWFAQTGNIDWINFTNKWGLTLLGVSLILGIGVRLSSSLGAVLMFSYYLPALSFPYVGSNSLLVDEHIIYILVLSFFALTRAGRCYGLEDWFGKIFLAKVPKFQKIWG